MKRTAEKPPVEVNRAWLQARALRYLDRFDASEKKLSQVLIQAARKAASETPDRETIKVWVGEVVARMVELGLVNDARHAQAIAQGSRAKGASARKIREKLMIRGISSETAQTAIDASSAECSELDAARTLARRKRLGPWRPEEERSLRMRNDLAALGRAGFSYSVARRALEAEADPELESDD